VLIGIEKQKLLEQFHPHRNAVLGCASLLTFDQKLIECLDFALWLGEIFEMFL
jgi:hypothetical protein